MKTQEITGNGTIGEEQGRDLKSCEGNPSCGFDPRPRHLLLLRLMVDLLISHVYFRLFVSQTDSHSDLLAMSVGSV